MTTHLQVLAPTPADTSTVLPPWLDGAHAALRRDLLDPAYPCTFGRAALRRGDLWTTYAEVGEPESLAADVATFLDLPPGPVGTRRPLVVFAEPGGEDDEDAYEKRFWAVLEHLHRRDDRPWPADVPDDPDTSGWQFCFHGCSIFVFALVPTVRRRHSRHLAPCLALVFMPRGVFTGIEVGTEAGNTSRTRIRAALRAWDDTPLHPSMGERYQLADDEWRQYFVTDQDEERHDRCPFDPSGTRRVQAGSR